MRTEGLISVVVCSSYPLGDSAPQKVKVSLIDAQTHILPNKQMAARKSGKLPTRGNWQTSCAQSSQRDRAAFSCVILSDLGASAYAS